MIIIGEKINGSIPSVGEAIKNKDAELIKELAKKETEANSTYIDVCASVEEDIEVDTMKWLIDLVQEVTDTPIAVDSPSADVIVKCLPFCKKEGLVNSVNMEGNKVDTVFPVIAKTGWECVALLSDDTGIPKSAEDRLKVFENLMKKAKEYEIDPSRLHIDPLVETLTAEEDGDEGIKMIIEVMTEIRKQYPTIHITGAMSNISFGLPARKYLNSACTILAMNAGLDSAIFDPLNRDLMGLIYATEALLGIDEFCMDYIGAFREGLFGTQKK
jgi:5-methyltetrahydrofolate--homocysteine methyltransferase